jgi:radical SAM protein with 4Fe4S-binding SPASM domain
MSESRIPAIQYKDFSLGVHERAGVASHVIKAQMEVTYRCNLHCVHCYTDPYNAREFFLREMTLKEILRLMDEMADLGILWLNLTGGEIFTRPDYFEIHEYAYNKGFLLQLFTNGTVFTEDIIAKLQQRPPFYLEISCHSASETAFDRFTQVHGSFRKFLKGLELLKVSSLPFRLKTKAMTWNKDELPQIQQLVESFGLEFRFTTSISPRLNGDLGPLAYRLSHEEIRTLEAEEAPQTKQEAEPCESGDWLFTPPEGLYRCGCATDTIHINAWGELGTCTLQYERRASLREYSLEDAINKVFTEVRALQYKTDSPCRTCEIHTFCDKSPTDARRQAGEPEAPIRHNCDVALARAERVSHRTLIHPMRSIAGKEWP